jgi:hypothetical protein
MNPEEAPLLKQTLRTTAFMLVPVAAFLAILSAVALFAVPSSSSTPKEQRVNVAGAATESPKATKGAQR